MKRSLYYIQKYACRLLAIIACGASITSCDNILDDGYGDCEVVEEYRIKFKYDYNMKYADAFAQEVRSVTLYAFGEDGKLAYQKTEEGEILKNEDYAMLIEMEPGNYDLIAWAGLEDQSSFVVPVLTPGVSTYNDLTCRMNRISRSRASVEEMDSVGYVKPLWHGKVDANLNSRATVTTHIIEVPLVKNTNTLRVILQQLSDKTVNVDEYRFVVTDDNGLMNYDNTLMEDNMLAYYPYYTAQGSAEIGRAEGNEALNVAVAELSVGRLVESQNPRLTITHREKNDTVLSIPLIDYFELCKMVAHYNISTQEYLDREDEYNMTFFLDQNNRWMNTQIIINDWIVRYNDITPEF